MIYFLWYILFWTLLNVTFETIIFSFVHLEMQSLDLSNKPIVNIVIGELGQDWSQAFLMILVKFTLVPTNHDILNHTCKYKFKDRTLSPITCKLTIILCAITLLCKLASTLTHVLPPFNRHHWTLYEKTLTPLRTPYLCRRLYHYNWQDHLIAHRLIFLVIGQFWDSIPPILAK